MALLRKIARWVKNLFKKEKPKKPKKPKKPITTFYKVLTRKVQKVFSSFLSFVSSLKLMSLNMTHNFKTILAMFVFNLKVLSGLTDRLFMVAFRP